MATDTEFQYASAARAFSTPSTAPYRVPSRVTSRSSLKRRQSRPRRDVSSPIPLSPTSSPPVRTRSPDRRSVIEDIADDDSLSPLDPRRFTPTLHASLVSEILSLRREVESKSKVIDDLEQSLQDSRTENETLNENLSQSTREVRSLKHQLQLLEGGTSSALTELAKERDQALENISDVRKKLEQAQKKARSREEELESIQLLWSQEKESWEGERRNLERKVHVVEGRLKVVLNEVAAAREASSFNAVPKSDTAESTKECATSKESDSASIHSSSQGRRRTSITSLSTDDGYDRHNVRYSVMSLANGHGLKNDTLNLAQELAFDEEDEEGFESFEDDDPTPMSPDALPEERPASVNSQTSFTLSLKARKILGLSFDDSIDGQAAAVPSELVPDQTQTAGSFSEERRFEYRDAGIQYSPPASPTLPPDAGNLQIEKEETDQVSPTNVLPHDGQQPAVPTSPLQMKDSGTITQSVDMVSTSCQTIDLPSPPETPKDLEPPPQPAAVPSSPITMISASTQTEETSNDYEDLKKASQALNVPAPFQMPIPTIAIHPPLSEPASPRNSVVLPPQTKSISCQTNFKTLFDGRSIGMQTEEIQIDARPVKLPPSLLPSAIPDLPPSAGALESPTQPFPVPPRLAKRGLYSSPVVEMPSKASKGKLSANVQAYPGDNDNGPLSDDYESGIRRPLRSSSLFAGFEQPSDEELPDIEEPDIFTDDELLNRPLMQYTLRRGKLVSRSSLDANDPLLEIDEPVSDSEAMHNALASLNNDDVFGASGICRTGSTRTMKRHVMMPSGSKEQDIRRAAMISNGAAAHQRTRARSPSDASNDAGSAGSSIAPPFPVPIRLSSKKHPRSREDTQSPTPTKRKNMADARKPSIVRRPTVRKARSAVPMSQDQHERSGSGSSSAVPSPPYAPDSPPYPPLPLDGVTVPRERQIGRKQSYGGAPAPHGPGRARGDSTTTTVHPTSVVDAIAQTMVGEWMFKYVRRRRSFGVNDAKENWDGKTTDEVSASVGGSGVRHKRWVWLAPYERAIMWSSKQPTSGPALLGKSGRKFTIKSVLDVKDDNPLPKGFNPQNQFNRSILILTPQRALKFTATSLERHFVWLTALSFLSDPSMGMHDLAALPPVPREEFAPSRQTATLRRNPIRDSIRVAKGKSRPRPKGKHSFTSQPAPVPELPADEPDYVDPAMDAADPPCVPRFSSHARKRSHTTPRPTAMRSFSSQASMPSWHNAGSSDAYSPVGHGFNSGRSSLSGRPSEISGASSTGTGNFFDAIGTVRMEAFIDRTDLIRYHNRARRRSRHFRKASNHWGQDNYLSSLDYPTYVDGNDMYYRSDGGH